MQITFKLIENTVNGYFLNKLFQSNSVQGHSLRNCFMWTEKGHIIHTLNFPTTCLSSSPVIKCLSVDKDDASNNKFKPIYSNCFFIRTLEKLCMIQAYEEPMVFTKNHTLNPVLVLSSKYPCALADLMHT